MGTFGGNGQCPHVHSKTGWRCIADEEHDGNHQYPNSTAAVPGNRGVNMDDPDYVCAMCGTTVGYGKSVAHTKYHAGLNDMVNSIKRLEMHLHTVETELRSLKMRRLI
jgi:hypothetical protein